MQPYEEIRMEVTLRTAPDVQDCDCHGRGYIVSDYDTFEHCPYHYRDQRHPEAEWCHRCGDADCFDSPDCSPPVAAKEPPPPRTAAEIFGNDDIPF